MFLLETAMLGFVNGSAENMLYIVHRCTLAMSCPQSHVLVYNPPLTMNGDVHSGPTLKSLEGTLVSTAHTESDLKVCHVNDTGKL